MGRNSTLSKRTQRLAEENVANARKTVRSARKAAQSGWHDITDALDYAVNRSSHMTGDAKSRLGDAYSRFHDIQDEGLRRTKAARDALAGKRTPRRRPWVAGAAMLGLAAGAVGTIYARRLAKAREQALAEDAAALVAADLAEQDPTFGHVSSTGPSASYPANGSSPAESATKVMSPRRATGSEATEPTDR